MYVCMYIYIIYIYMYIYKYFKLEKIKLNIYYFKFHVSNHQVNDLALLKMLLQLYISN